MPEVENTQSPDQSANRCQLFRPSSSPDENLQLTNPQQRVTEEYEANFQLIAKKNSGHIPHGGLSITPNEWTSANGGAPADFDGILRNEESLRQQSFFNTNNHRSNTNNSTEEDNSAVHNHNLRSLKIKKRNPLEDSVDDNPRSNGMIEGRVRKRARRQTDASDISQLPLIIKSLNRICGKLPLKNLNLQKITSMTTEAIMTRLKNDDVLGRPPQICSSIPK
ncbi:hypothetical protein PPACK8108_LOCUS11294 [Phakopsora pachyrhizi]|uniref:Uncharacterized protein n=1 Tax=Phakopsora pachyrhizi TaxID=170000 RepID=A0AAV0B2R9_PHAPC|nr:hypothetical protein PPACK8108_LOCUS11294 [Phakopsora pachyrhizi]